MEILELLQPCIKNDREFIFLFHRYINKSLIWVPKLHGSKLHGSLKKFLAKIMR